MSRAEPRRRVSREEWVKSVERWRDSGLTAKEFASELGINPSTLQQWKYQFDGERRGTRAPGSRGRAAAAAPVAGFVKVSAEVVAGAQSFEVTVGRFQVKVPPSSEAKALRALLQTLEGCQ